MTVAVTDLASLGASASFEISATLQRTVEPAGGAVTKVTVILAMIVPDTVTDASAEGAGINVAAKKQASAAPKARFRRKRRLGAQR